MAFPSNTFSDPYSAEYSHETFCSPLSFSSLVLCPARSSHADPPDSQLSSHISGCSRLHLHPPSLHCSLEGCRAIIGHPLFFPASQGSFFALPDVQDCENDCLICSVCLFPLFHSDGRFCLWYAILNESKSLPALDFSGLLTVYPWFGGKFQCTEEEHGF